MMKEYHIKKQRKCGKVRAASVKIQNVKLYIPREQRAGKKTEDILKCCARSLLYETETFKANTTEVLEFL